MSSEVKFKSVKRKRKQFRKRNEEEEEKEMEENREMEEEEGEEGEGEGGHRTKIQETLEMQKLRQRTAGLSHLTLAKGKKLTKVEEELAKSSEDGDPFKLKTGGLLDLRRAKMARAIENGEEVSGDKSDDAGRGGEMEGVVGTQFSKETRIRDEDEEMRKFIEGEMEKRKRGPRDTDDDQRRSGYVAPEDKALLSLPDHLRKSTFRKNEEMLSSQMLSGIPEVDLGIEEKIRNIEATEAAKKAAAAVEEAKRRKRMLEKQAQLSDVGSSGVPSNLAVNFKQPNRFKTEEEIGADKSVNKVQLVTQRTVVVGDKPVERVIKIGADSDDGAMGRVAPDKATDDLHVTKFKQHFQRK